MPGSVDFLPGSRTGITTEDGLKSGDAASPFEKSTFEFTMEKIMTVMSAKSQTDIDKLMNCAISTMKDSQANVATDTNNVLSALDKAEERKKKLEL